MKQFFLVTSLLSLSLHSAQLSLNTAATSAILINAQTGKVLYQKNPNLKLSPASTTKIATCLMILHKVKSLDEVVQSPADCLLKVSKKVKIERKYQDPPFRLEPDGTSYGILPNEKLTVRDLLHGMMLSSGNDASNVLAHYVSGGNIQKFMEETNEYLQSIGCYNTKFFNPHGLHYPNHLTTAKDLAILAKEAMRNPEFAKIVKTAAYERPKTNKQAAKSIVTTNRLIKKGPQYFSKAIGVKSGYHEIAGSNFVGAAESDGRVLISVVMKCQNAREAYKDTLKLFDAAFSEKKLARVLLNHQESLFSKSVKGTKKLLEASLKSDLVVEYYPSEEEGYYPDIKWLDVSLPIFKGEKVGEVFVKLQNNQIILKQDLYASKSLELSTFQKIVQECLNHVIALSLSIFGLMLGGLTLFFYLLKQRKITELEIDKN